MNSAPMNRALMAIVLAVSGATAACAGSLPVTLLSPAANVDQLCGELPQTGITCVRADMDPPPSGLGNGALPMSQNDYAFLDRSDRPQVKGFLVLTGMKSPGGNDYYQASAKIYKTGFAGVGMTSTDLYDQPFWDELGAHMAFAPPSDPRVAQYLVGMDEKIAKDAEIASARAAQKRAVADQVASEASYRASPRYAQDQARQQVEACKLTIPRARSAIAQDERVAQISGYENKLLREQAAVSIVTCQDILARNGRMPQ